MRGTRDGKRGRCPPHLGWETGQALPDPQRGKLRHGASQGGGSCRLLQRRAPPKAFTCWVWLLPLRPMRVCGVAEPARPWQVACGRPSFLLLQAGGAHKRLPCLPRLYRSSSCLDPTGLGSRAPLASQQRLPVGAPGKHHLTPWAPLGDLVPRHKHAALNSPIRSTLDSAQPSGADPRTP